MTLLHGLSEGLNSIALMTYIEKMYEATYLNEKSPVLAKRIVSNFTLVLLCYNHISKNVANQLKPETKPLIMGIVRLIASTTNYFDFLNLVLYHLCVVCNKVCRNEFVVNSIKVLEDSYEIEHGHLKLCEGIIDNKIEKQEVLGLACQKLQYEQSHFYFDCVGINKISMEKVCKNEEDKELNNSYAPEFIEYFLKKLAPFMPLIAPFLRVIKGQRSVNRSSNAVVEGSFNQLKMHIRESSELHLND